MISLDRKQVYFGKKMKSWLASKIPKIPVKRLLMDTFKKEKKALPSTMTYSPSYGSLGVIKPALTIPPSTTVYWYHCREQFHAYGDPLKLSNYYYSVESGKRDNVAYMIHLLEKHLGVEKRTTFQYVERDGVGVDHMIWLNVSPWWIENPMKHQFFTVALRAGRNYDSTINGWMHTLKNISYTAATPEATERFLNGYTHYTGNIRGWQRQFTGVDNQNIKPVGAALKALLQLPPDVKHKRTSEIAFCLWKADGEKQGLDHEYWSKAEQELAKKDS